MLFENPRASRAPYPPELRALLSIERANESRRWLSNWQGISNSATPLRQLPEIAKSLGIASLFVKDESERSTLGSFKALGAPVALIRQILRVYPHLVPEQILKGQYLSLLNEYTVISATDGNHGRSLAAAAQDAGCRCVIVLHAHVSEERETAIAKYGARIVRITGNYDDSVNEAARLAKANGWQVISDTSYEGYEDIPRDVMQGYGTIAEEVIEQQAPDRETPPFSHVFLQGGVGGLAAGVASYLWERYGANRPTFIAVEPVQADCLMQSAMTGTASRATGSVDSVMAGLACGETSPLAWRFLEESMDHFMTVTDKQAISAMRLLAKGSLLDIPIVAGESGVAGLAALQLLRETKTQSDPIELTNTSRVLIINTEGATAPSVYFDLVGESHTSVKARQAIWLRQHESGRYPVEIGL